MIQYIILLRGVNVGGRTIKMAELRTCFEQAGYQKVQTVLQTGNVIVESKEKNKDRLRRQVETLLTQAFDYPAKVLVYTPGEVDAVIQNYPFKDQGPEFHRYAIFMETGVKELMQQAGTLDQSIEEISPGKEVIYWRVLKGHTLNSAFGKYLAKAAAKYSMTNRNLNTLEKISAKCK